MKPYTEEFNNTISDTLYENAYFVPLQINVSKMASQDVEIQVIFNIYASSDAFDSRESPIGQTAKVYGMSRSTWDNAMDALNNVVDMLYIKHLTPF